MKKVSVALLVISSSLTLDELSLLFGRSPSSGSQNKGDIRRAAEAGKELWPHTIWRFDSDAPESASVQDQLERLQIQFPALELKRSLPGDCEVMVDVALFFETANVSATFSQRATQIIVSYNAQLEITCYPSRFDLLTVCG
jgi:hypothetical protein